MSDKTPLVSVIMNCYNGEKYLLQALKSVIEQKYQNWELIFWDNKSTDSSKQIFNSINDNRLKYFSATKFTSLYKARNLAIEKSSGSYISFLDVDDYWTPNKLEDQINLINIKNPGVVYGNLWVYSEKKNKRKIYSKTKLYEGYISKRIVEKYSVGLNTIILKKSKLFELDKKFDERFNHIGDFDLMFRLSKITNFLAIQNPIAVYRAHEKNLSTIDRSGSINELEIWLSENKNDLDKKQFFQFQKNIDTRKIIYFKTCGNHFQAIKLLFKLKNFNIRNIIITILPTFIVKNIFWY